MNSADWADWARVFRAGAEKALAGASERATSAQVGSGIIPVLTAQAVILSAQADECDSIAREHKGREDF